MKYDCIDYTYEESVEYLYSIPAFAGKNSFENTRDFMHELGQFEDMDNVIHVAGTNGKGSVCSFVQSVLIRAGYNVGMFTSPHLIRINERIRINGKEVSDEEFARSFNIVKNVADKMVEEGNNHPSFFEFVFGIACVIFKKRKPDYIILETGLGGRLDATNIINKPIVTAITTIGIDHTEYLGNTIEEIAKEKAGIIKKGVPVVFDADNDKSAQVIIEKATMYNCKYVKVFEQFVKFIKNSDKHIDFLAKYGYDNICIKLDTNGLYQMKNVQIAIEIIRIILKDLEVTVIKDGLENAVWHGRMEWVEPDFLLDGAHNISGIEQLVRTVSSINKKVILIFSAANDKDYEKMIQILCGDLEIVEVIITKVKISRMENTDILKDIFNIHFDRDIYIEEDCLEAISLAKDHLANYDDTIILAAGSLYLIGEILSVLENDNFYLC